MNIPLLLLQATSGPADSSQPKSVAGDAVHAAAEKIDQAKDWVKDMTDFVLKMLTEYGFRVLGAVIVLIIAFIVAGWARRAAKAGLDRAHFDPTISKFGANVAKYLVLVLGLLTCAPIMGINVTMFATVLGAGGLAIGLASQGALSNLAAGLMLLVTRPFKVGDLILVDGVSGIVEEIELFTTKLNTPDNRRIFMPNNSIFGKVIENSTHNPHRATTFSVFTAGDSNIDQVRSTLSKACVGCELVLKDPAPGVLVSNMEGGGLKWDITVWSETRKLALTRDQAIIAVRDAIAASGIKPPVAVTNMRILERVNG